MKHFLTFVLLLSCCYYLTTAQITDNEDTDWTDAELDLVEINPLLLSLSDFGAQEVVGQALDSRRVVGSNGTVQKINEVRQLFRDGVLQYDFDSIINIDDTDISGSYRVLWNPVDNFKQVLAWSFTILGNDLRNPSGSQIAWDLASNQVRIWDVTNADQWVALLAGNEANPGVFSLSDYLTNVLAYQPIDVTTIANNTAVQNGLNDGIDTLSDERNLPGLAVSNLVSVFNYSDPSLGNFLRYEGDVATNSSSGRAVWVWACGRSATCNNGTLARHWYNSLLA